MRARSLASLFLGLLVLGSLAKEARAFAYWNDVRHSATLPDGRAVIRAENPSGGGSSNSLLYSTGTVQEANMTAVPDGPATVEAAAPGPVTQRSFYGFRYLHGSEIDFQPVRLVDGAAPTPGGLTRVATDAANDQIPNSPTNLDLVDCRVSFDGTRLMAALRNNGGGFPVSSGLTFYAYLLGIADPSDADPDTVFAMLYTFNQPPIISPGLYKILGTDLVKIGEITWTVFPSENTLVLTCQLANLYSDPVFASWFDPVERRISVAGFTQKIPLSGGPQEADRTPGGDAYLRDFWIDPGVNHLPSLQGMQIVGAGASAFVQVTYADADAHCPVVSEVRFDGGVPYPMRPQSLDYATAVVYRTAPGIPPLVNGGWSTATARFSDNQADLVEAQLSSAAGPEDGAGPAGEPPPSAGCAPNPFRTEVVFRVEGAGEGPLRVEIVDLLGRVVRVLAIDTPSGPAATIRWDGRDERGRPVPAGGYFWRAGSRRGTVGSRILRVP